MIDWQRVLYLALVSRFLDDTEEERLVPEKEVLYQFSGGSSLTRFENNELDVAGISVNDIDRVRNLPCTIVQGRYDIVCPPVTAEALARAWPEARYIVVPDAGHSALEPGIRSALVNATESYRLSLTDDDLFAPRFPWETG